MLDVLTYVNEEKKKLKDEVTKISIEHGSPRMAIITDCKNMDANMSYIKSKVAFANEIGVVCDVFFVNNIDEVNLRSYDGAIVQYPFGDYSFEEFRELVTQYIPPKLDIDGLGRRSLFRPCTPLGIYRYMEHLRKEDVLPHHTTVNIVGAGGLVGKPLAEMLLEDSRYTVTVTRSKTSPSVAYMLHDMADVVVCATPETDIIPVPSHLKVYVDCGCKLVEGKLLGNVSRKWYSDEMMITPVPNGVGKLTVLALFQNLLGVRDE